MAFDKGKDLEVWRDWKGNQTSPNMQRVLDRMNPVVQGEVNRWSGTLARPLLELEAKRLAAEAIKSYSPGRGAALATHVTNRLRKLSRISYTHQNLARIPEYQTMQFHTYQNAKTDLEDKLGREPSGSELSQQLGWSTPYLSRFQNSMRKEFLESGEPPPIFDKPSDDSGLIDFIYNDLSPQQQKIFQHTTGYMGAPVLSNRKLMERMKLSQGQLSYQKRLLTNHVKDLTGGGVS
jgi:DNA-directed RNA polymerase specialized sigma subunit